MSPAIIEFQNVVKSFGQQRVLDDVSVSFKSGKTTVIGGGSGQGKSVTLKLILGLLSPDSGQILVNGRDITRMKQRELNKIREKFGVLFQGSALLDSMTVFDNVALPLNERTKYKSQEIAQRVRQMLAQFNLEGHEDKFPAQLSGGMKKRVGLARALMLQPDIMLFDEPTTGLDPQITMDIYRLFFKSQKQFGYTSIIVSHDIPKVFNLADEVVLLNKGKMMTFSSPEDIPLSTEPEIVSFATETMGHIYSSRKMEHNI
ncbi:MAG: ATP-binding cassette domain-containing protein [Proteobacteria bacterium]|nr:ATP-binding cassette domain-containing protein [Pseudomonadota bacterium]MBU4297536.1 ATP-binding cassette domain-containing protein [Pseudomonadota bacterium]MCG2749754.1 ATP-binding cassette domain-containing protein [Desulfobulbaceae bacterium]